MNNDWCQQKFFKFIIFKRLFCFVFFFNKINIFFPKVLCGLTRWLIIIILHWFRLRLNKFKFEIHLESSHLLTLRGSKFLTSFLSNPLFQNSYPKCNFCKHFLNLSRNFFKILWKAFASICNRLIKAKLFLFNLTIWASYY